MKCLSQLLAILLFLLACLTLNAQQVTKVYQDYDIFKDGKVQIPTTYFIQEGSTENIHINIPEKGFGLVLERVDLLSEDFFVETSDGGILNSVDGRFYIGKIDNDPNSTATVSIYKDNVICSYSNKDGNFEITGQHSKKYLINKIPAHRDIPFECYTEDTPIKNTISESNLVGCKAIQIYFEADYKLYQDKGSSVTNTVNYITALFNQVAMLYANEQIVVQISQIKVWNTPDPYISYTNTSSVLNAFRTTLGTNFNGNLAHFLSTRPLGGGIAYLDVLCVKSYAFGVSAISVNFQNIPTYSWSVEVITHELGHNIGAWHTQSCNWPNGALDNCYPTEGGCPSGPAPINGGTIMSYCHLTGYGINFSNGFGPVPGNLIRSKFNNSPCITGTSASPSNLQTLSITQTTATLQWSPVSGAMSYTLQYKPSSSSTWTTVLVGLNTTYNLTGLTSNTQYQWQVKTDCSNYTAPVSFTTTGQSGCNLLLTTGVTSITQTSAFIYWVPITGANSYNLQYKLLNSSNWIEVSGIPVNIYALSNLQPNSVYMVRVRPNCNLNYGTYTQFTTLPVVGGCPAPTGLQTTNLTPTKATFSWQPQSFATGYSMQFKFPGTENWITFNGPFYSTSVNIVGLQPNSTYQWRVKNQCSDWSVTMVFTTPAQIIEMIGVISPNPTNGIFKLENETGIGELYNINGQKVSDFQLDGTCIDIQNMPNGIYYMRINGRSYKIIKI